MNRQNPSKCFKYIQITPSHFIFIRGQRAILELQDMVNAMERENETVRETLKNNGETLVNVKEAIITLLEKLTEIKLPSPEHR